MRKKWADDEVTAKANPLHNVEASLETCHRRTTRQLETSWEKYCCHRRTTRQLETSWEKYCRQWVLFWGFYAARTGVAKLSVALPNALVLMCQKKNTITTSLTSGILTMVLSCQYTGKKIVYSLPQFFILKMVIGYCIASGQSVACKYRVEYRIASNGCKERKKSSNNYYVNMYTLSSRLVNWHQSQENSVHLNFPARSMMHFMQLQVSILASGRCPRSRTEWIDSQRILVLPRIIMFATTSPVVPWLIFLPWQMRAGSKKLHTYPSLGLFSSPQHLDSLSHANTE